MSKAAINSSPAAEQRMYGYIRVSTREQNEARQVIALQEFDPGAPEVTYWGTAYDNTTTTIDYTGEPVWVRPWWTQAKDTDGRFPEWFTHWDSDIDRPTTNRLSSAVFYLEGDDDSEGLVGYHTNADGSLEKVTAEQVYAWAYGVDVGYQYTQYRQGRFLCRIQESRKGADAVCFSTVPV